MLSVISNKNKYNALLVFLVAIVSQLQLHTVHGAIIITLEEEKCLEKTGKMFDSADAEDLLKARNDFSTSMEMDTTSKQKMYAKYPEEQVKNYDAYCTKYGGKLHTIKLDFFDCIMRGAKTDIELTLKNFATCMAKTEECEGFRQEHLLQEAWKDLGLMCELEEEETKKDPPTKDAPKNKYDDNDVDNDLAKREKEATAGGADEVDKEEKASEYVPKEQMDKNGNKKKTKKSSSGSSNGGKFMKFLLFASVCGVGYFVFDRRRRGLPIQLPSFFGGVTTSRFQARPQTGFVSNYNLLSGEENELQLSSNLA